jgi:hypothetical protein
MFATSDTLRAKACAALALRRGYEAQSLAS